MQLLKGSTASRLGRDAGVTLIEATVILGIMAVLLAAAAPATSRTLATARLSRVTEDTDAIATAIHNFITDNSFVPFTITGGSAGDVVEMLVSDGDIPISGIGATNWDDVVGVGAPAVDVDFLEKHLVTNVLTGGAPNAYTTGATGWRGAYINAPVDPDPWGNRYAVNVEYLKTSTSNDVFVLSAGPNEQIDTAYTLNGARPGDDDITSVVRRDIGQVVP
jgi:type II secretory pathway pseudopilin PulG